MSWKGSVIIGTWDHYLWWLFLGPTHQPNVQQNKTTHWSFLPALFQIPDSGYSIQGPIRPHVEYCPYIWDPSTIILKQQLESVKKFALRVCLKQWDMPYSDMLALTGLSRLESRRSVHKLSLTFKIINGLVYFPNGIYSLSTTRSSPRISHSMSLHRYSCSTSQFLYSCIPHSISLWNSLPFDPNNFNVLEFTENAVRNYIM